MGNNSIIHKDSSIQFQRKNGEVVEITKLKPNGRELREIRGGEVALIFDIPKLIEYKIQKGVLR